MEVPIARDPGLQRVGGDGPHGHEPSVDNVAAIATPNLLRAKMAANESVAVTGDSLAFDAPGAFADFGKG